MNGQLPAKRPLGVTALACFFLFGTLASGVSLFSVLNPGGPFEKMWKLNPRAHEQFLSMGYWATVVLGPVCLACAASAYGFFKGRRWGYWMGIGLLLVNLTGDLINAGLGIERRALVGVPIVVLLLIYLRSARVKAFFG